MSKVIWVINQFAGKPDSGWGERHYFFAKRWADRGYKVKIISGSYNHLFINQPKVSNSNFTLEKVEDNITFCWVKIPEYNPESVLKLFSMIVFSLRILFLSKEKLDKPKVIIISSMPIFSVLSAYLLSIKYKSKFIFEVRDLWPETPKHLKGYSKYHPMILLMSWLEKIGFRKSDQIVSVLPNAAPYINKISKNPEKFNYIPNGIDLTEKNVDLLPKEIINKIPKNKFIIGYTGTIGLANAMEYFIDASIMLKDDKRFHFILVGEGYLKNNFIDKTSLNNNITFIDKIKKSQVQAILRYFDVCYLGRYNTPLYKHGVSYNKYFDYMLAKKPILESSNYIKDQVELSGCGSIVKPEDPEAIIEGIIKMYKLTERERNLLGMKGYNYCIKNHNFDHLSDKYLKIIES